MTRLRTDKYNKHDAFSTPKGTDPNMLAVQPPDPYSLLIPGVVIQEGDIKRTVGDGFQWELALEREWGYNTPLSGIAFARVSVPEGYVLMAPGDYWVGPQILVWTSTRSEWLYLANHPDYEGMIGGEKLTVREVMAANLKKNQQVFFAKPDPKVAHKVQEVLPRTRVLWPGEKLRYRDKILYEGITEWQDIQEVAFGQAVQVAGAENGNMRACRPVGPNFQTWYISEEKGKPEHMGGATDPWPDQAVADLRIKQASEVARIAPHGLIWDLDKQIPVAVYDMPVDVAPVTQTAEQVEQILSQPAVVVEQNRQQMVQAIEQEASQQFMAAVNAEIEQPAAGDPKVSGDVTDLRRGSEPVPDDGPVTSGVNQYDTNWIADNTGMTIDEVLGEAMRLLPANYRMMEPGEEVAAKDLIFKPSDHDPEMLQWTLVMPDLHGARIGMHDFILARRTVKPGSAAAVLPQITELKKLHQSAVETMQSLALIMQQQYEKITEIEQALRGTK